MNGKTTPNDKNSYRMPATIINPGIDNLPDEPVMANLLALEQATHAMCHFWEDVLTDSPGNEFRKDVDECMARLITALDLPFDDSDDPDISAVGQAMCRMTEIINVLILNYETLSHGEAQPKLPIRILMDTARLNRVGSPLDDQEFIENLPWLIRYAADNLMSSGIYEFNPLGGASICARMLACILDRLQEIPGMKFEPNQLSVVGGAS